MNRWPRKRTAVLLTLDPYVDEPLPADRAHRARPKAGDAEDRVRHRELIPVAGGDGGVLEAPAPEDDAMRVKRSGERQPLLGRRQERRSESSTQRAAADFELLGSARDIKIERLQLRERSRLGLPVTT